MKKSLLFALAATVFAACSDDNNYYVNPKTTIGFEDAKLGDTGYLWGKPLATQQDGVDWMGNPIKTNLFSGVLYSEADVAVRSYFNDFGGTYDTWYGFVISSQTDRVTEGYTNDKSVYAEGGDGGSKAFAVGYYDAFGSAAGDGVPMIEFTGGVKPLSVAVANTTYFYLWFKGTSQAEVVDAYVVVTGWNGGVKTGEVRVKMADGTSKEVKSGWETVDLNSLGRVTSLTFTTVNEDLSGYVPNYFAIDNLIYLR